MITVFLNLAHPGMLNDSRVAAVLGSWISELKRKNPAVLRVGFFESLS
jgi:hypothetical protein